MKKTTGTVGGIKINHRMEVMNSKDKKYRDCMRQETTPGAG
jgi:hypothetical protein